MGEAKRKKSNIEPLTPEARFSMLGSDPFPTCMDQVYGMAEYVYSRSGMVNHQLIGLEMLDGSVTGVNVLYVKRIEDAPKLRDELLQRFPMVAHVFEAWSAPDRTAAPSAHPKRTEIVSISLHSLEAAVFMQCPADPKQRKVVRGEVIVPTEVKGRLGRELEKRTLSS